MGLWTKSQSIDRHAFTQFLVHSRDACTMYGKDVRVAPRLFEKNTTHALKGTSISKTECPFFGLNSIPKRDETINGE